MTPFNQLHKESENGIEVMFAGKEEIMEPKGKGIKMVMNTLISSEILRK
jgi:hypothetical protein